MASYEHEVQPSPGALVAAELERLRGEVALLRQQSLVDGGTIADLHVQVQALLTRAETAEGQNKRLHMALSRVSAAVPPAVGDAAPHPGLTNAGKAVVDRIERLPVLALKHDGCLDCGHLCERPQDGKCGMCEPDYTMDGDVTYTGWTEMDPPPPGGCECETCRFYGVERWYFPCSQCFETSDVATGTYVLTQWRPR